LSPDGDQPDAATSVSRFIAHAITWIAATFDPEQIYLGGGVSTAGYPFLDAVRARLRDAARNSSVAAQRIDPDAITLAPIDGSTGPRGAAVLAQRLRSSMTSFTPSKATSTPTNGGEI
ncbi:MAG: ROK family protein, partial [Acidimicrobiia bacterium]